MGQYGPLFVYFRLFDITQFNKLMKQKIACLGLEPRVAGWKAQTNPLSYGGTEPGELYLPKLCGFIIFSNLHENKREREREREKKENIFPISILRKLNMK